MRGAVWALAVLLVAVAGCSSPALESRVGDPCSVLDASFIEEVTGLSFGDGMAGKDGGPDHLRCVWEDPSVASLEVSLSSGDDIDVARQLSAGPAGRIDVPIDVSGADEAYRTDDGAIVLARVDETMVSVGFLTEDLGDVTAITERLINEVVTNLP